MHTTKTRRLLQAAAALAAGAALALGAATTADAAEPSASAAPQTPAANASTVDKTRLGAIVIHKYRQPAASATVPGDGTEQDTTVLIPVAGVGLLVQQVDPATFDLTTNEGWQAASTLTPERAAILSKGYAVGVRTDAHGVATAPDLPLGVYLISEVDWPTGVEHGSPFLVTVPLTDPENLSSWLYTVNVYPKSAVADPPSPRAPTPTPTPTPTRTQTPATQVAVPGAWVHTGGAAAEAAADWVAQYWAALCAAVAIAAGGTAGLAFARRRRRPRRAHRAAH